MDTCSFSISVLFPTTFLSDIAKAAERRQSLTIIRKQMGLTLLVVSVRPHERRAYKSNANA
jgi:hypothetical protein